MFVHKMVLYKVSPNLSCKFLVVFLFFVFCFFINLFLFIYFWLHWVFVVVCGLSLVVATGGCSAVVAHGLSRSAACGILPGQGPNPNPRPLHWQADSQPMRHEGSPFLLVLILLLTIYAHSSGELEDFSSSFYFTHLLFLLWEEYKNT